MSKDKQVKELMALADIREVLGVGHKPMLSELVEIIRELVRDKARLDWMLLADGDQLNALRAWTRGAIDDAMGEEASEQ